MIQSLNDKHIVVTGGTGALGEAVAAALLEQHALVSIPCYDASELDGFDLKDSDHLFLQTGIDLTDEQATQQFYKNAVESQGKLWASVHIAGGFAMGKVADTSKKDFMRQVNMNLVTCFNACKVAVNHQQKSGGGRIVNVSSRPGVSPRQGAGRSAYAVSKAGVAALTQSLAAEVVEDGILVNAVVPSVIDTPQNRQSMPNANFERWPKPAEIANQILYLISEQNTLTQGALVPVYGRG